MSNNKSIAFLVLLLTTFSGFAQIQTPALDNLAGNLVSNLRSETNEIIFIHTDKSVYLAGENVWFNAYLINKVSHKLSHRSKIVFVDLVNDQDSVIERLVLDPASLTLDGRIQLPIFLAGGNYWLRAYTYHMLHADSNDICVRPIFVVNPQNMPAGSLHKTPGDSKESPSTGAPQVALYPEGGAMIAGVNKMVGLTVFDQNNQPIEVAGIVKDNRDSIAASFKTSFPGYGEFSLFPWKTRRYTVFIRTKDDRQYSYPLPLTDNGAACLSLVNENENSIRMLVSLGDSLYDRKTKTYLLGISRDSLCFAGVGETMYETVIPKSNFPQGEATFLLFDEQERLLSERSVYIDEPSISVDVIPNHQESSSREDLGLSISISGKDQRPLLSLVSVSVTDDSAVKYFDEGNIQTLKDDRLNPREQDLILMTQRPHYSNWASADTGSVQHDEEEQFFSVGGKISDTKGQVLTGGHVSIISTRPQNIFITDTIAVDGSFQFFLPFYYDSTEFKLQVTDKKGKFIDAKLNLDQKSFPKLRTSPFLKRYIEVEAQNEIRQKESDKRDLLLPGEGKELREVILKTRVKKPVTYDEKQRISQFSRIVTADMILESGTESVVNSVLTLPGVHYRNGRLAVAGGIGEPMLVINGVALDPHTLVIDAMQGTSPVVAYINQLSPKDIDFIEVLSGPDAAYYGVRGGNGVISIHTNSGGSGGARGNSSLETLYPTGFSHAASFAGPDYTKREIRKSPVPDRRSTVYWSGPVITDGSGKLLLNFFTSDSHASYTVSVEGITQSGDIIQKRISIHRK